MMASAVCKEKTPVSTAHLGVGALRHLSQVVLSARGDPAEEDLLRDSAPQSHAHAVQQLLLRVQVLLFGQVLRVAQTLPSGDDGHLCRSQHKLMSLHQPPFKFHSIVQLQHRGDRVTFSSGSACSRNHPATACPAS